MFKDFSTKDKTKFETKDKAKTQDGGKTTLKTRNKTKTVDKDKTKDILDQINNKIDTINKPNNLLAKLKAKLTKKVELIYESLCELQDEIYSDDSWLRLVELNKLDAILDDALNVTWNMICKKIEQAQT